MEIKLRHRRDVDFHPGNRVLQHIHLVSVGRTYAFKKRIAYKLLTATTQKKARRSRSATAPINPNRKKAFFVSVLSADVDASVGYSVSSSSAAKPPPPLPPPPPNASEVSSSSYSSPALGLSAVLGLRTSVPPTKPASTSTSAEMLVFGCKTIF